MQEEEESNIERKEKGESLSGGESSAEYIISKSEGESQLPDRAKKISPATDTKNPTVESANIERKERGESLPGGESSAEYMASRSGEEEEEPKKKAESEKDIDTMADKIKAGAKALKKKAEDTPKKI
ncbi:MAG: hypothetical protein ACJ70O_02650 [Nitrososphaera sp.]